jgi:hypothetical protein
VGKKQVRENESKDHREETVAKGLREYAAGKALHRAARFVFSLHRFSSVPTTWPISFIVLNVCTISAIARGLAI